MLYRFANANCRGDSIDYNLINQVVAQAASHLIPTEYVCSNPTKGDKTRYNVTALYPRCNAQRTKGVSSLVAPFLNERFKTTFHTISRQHTKNFFVDVDPGYRVDMGLIVKGVSTNKMEIERLVHHYDVSVGNMNSTWFVHHPFNPVKPPQFDIDFDTVTTLKVETHTGITKLFLKQLEIFSKLFNKNYFVHYYTEYGMEIEEMQESFEMVTQLCEDYNKARPLVQPGFEQERVVDNWRPMLKTFRTF